MARKEQNRQRALITGASSGLGYHFAEIFAENGYDLVLVARSTDKLQSLADRLSKERNVRCQVLSKDLSVVGACDEIYKELRSSGTSIDVLVNNAGFGTYGLFHEMPLGKEHGMIQVNIAALTELTRRFLPEMLQKKSGKILNVASTAAFQPGPLMAVYYATKAYVLSFSEALANEVAGTGVTVTALCPGPTETGFQKEAQMEKSKLLKRAAMMDAKEAAQAGFDGMVKGKVIVIPGLTNALGAQSVRFFPRKIVTSLVRKLQEST